MIEFDSIRITFGGKPLFQEFSLKVHKGEKVLLSAPSGKGKSTLMRALLGFQAIDDGEIRVDNRILSKETIYQIRTQIAYVSQDVELGQETAELLIESVFNFKENRRISPSREICKTLGMDFGLGEDFLSKKVSQFSGGERQRLGLLICVLLKRPIWILDEITSGLDKTLKEQIVNKVLSGEETVLITSHDDIWLNDKRVRVVEW